MSTKTLNPCACSQPEFIKADGAYYTTQCAADTRRTFAPGHDARLKGFLIRAAVAGEKIRVNGKNIDPMDLANSHGFGYLVQAGVDNAKSRAANKRAPKEKAPAKGKKAAPAAPKTHLVEQATAKIGRWVKHGTYDHDSKTFTYRDAAGNAIETTKFANLELV